MARFRPTLIPTLLTLPALAVLLGLGTWQLQRLAWKEALIAERQTGLAAPAVSLTAVDAGTLGRLAHRRVRAVGRFLDDRSLFYGAGALAGRPGADLLTPLRLAGGGTVLVNRGRVPLDFPLPRSAADAAVEIDGVLRPARREGNWFTPEPDLKRGHWYLYDTNAMGRHLGLDLAPAVVEAMPGAEAEPLPRARTPEIDLRNDHLAYALTWYALALALLSIYVAYHLKRGS